MFDDAELWDTHRPRGVCVHDPGELGLVATRNGIWLRAPAAAGRAG